ncbi:MAG: hypothetical protein H7323_11885 [Frankiales bacterium]|nr:hypothetical protein [Frankiales bacterium]
MLVRGRRSASLAAVALSSGLLAACGPQGSDAVVAGATSTVRLSATPQAPRPDPARYDTESTDWQEPAGAEASMAVLRRIFAERIGLTAFDNERRRVVVLVVDLTPEDVALARRSVLPQTLPHLELGPAQFSQNELQIVQQQVRDVTDRFPFEQYYGGGFDRETPRIEIQLGPGAERLRDALVRELPSGSYFFTFPRTRPSIVLD